MSTTTPTTNLPFPGATDAAVAAFNDADKLARRVGEANSGDTKAAKAARRHVADLLRHAAALSAALGQPVAVLPKAPLERYVRACDDLASLAGTIQCLMDREDCPEGKHNEDTHRRVADADEQAILSALEA